MKIFTASLIELGAATFFVCEVSAAVLTSVPMQGTMVMPMVSYRASDGALTVRMNPETVHLTPLLVSNPDDSFAAAAPWFQFLDPSGQGLSFSRRYGFAMDTASDPLPQGTAFEIQCLSMTPGLHAWRYRANPPTWEPIFGALGSPEVSRWDGIMFHPTFAAAPGTNLLKAVFEIALADASSGQRLTNASTGPFTLEFSNMPDGRPRLQIIGQELRWSNAGPSHYVLESCENLAEGKWVTATNGVQNLESWSRLTLDFERPCRFYRLRRGP